MEGATLHTETPATQQRPAPSPRKGRNGGLAVRASELRRTLSAWTGAAHLGAPVDAGHAPRLRQLAGMSTWAAALTFGGLIIAIRSVVGIIAGDAPAWFEPIIIIIGLVGIGFAAAAFVFAQLPRLVWIALSISTAVLVLATVLTALAL